MQNSSPSLLKNSAFLTGKAIISIGIAFFSSRLLFKALGQSDFGLYDVVAGFILLLSSLRTLSSTSIQRFINVAKGEDDIKQMNAVLSLGILIHIALTILFLVLAETVGLWYVNNKMVIAPNRLVAANYVYQFSVVMGACSVLVTPFEGLIIAHERLKFFAINTTLELVVKLLIIISLSYSNYDSLLLYALLLMFSTLLFRFNIFRYCIKHIKLYSYKVFWDKPLFKKLVTFSGWNFLGSITFIICHQGINLILNFFGGTIINAARGIAYQIMNALNQVISNLTLAVSPRVMTNYANEKEKALNLLFFTTKMVFYLLLALVTPLVLFLDNYIILWLDEVPKYASIFSALIIGYILVKLFVNALNTLFYSNGNLKYSHSIQSVLSVLVVVLSYYALKQGNPFYYVFLILLIVEILKIVVLVILLNCQLKISSATIITKQFLGPIIVSVLVITSCFFIKNEILLRSNIVFVILYSVLIFISVALLAYIFGVTKLEQNLLKQTLISKVFKIK